MEPLANEPKKEQQTQEHYDIKSFKASQLPHEYENLILAPFLNSLKYGNDLFTLVEKDAYYLNYPLYIKALLKRENATINIALLDDKTALGWCLFEQKTVHYVWVKDYLRRNGIGMALLPKEFNTITHITKKGIIIWANKFPHVIFNPWA